MAYDISDLYKRYPELKKIDYSITDAFSILKRTVSKDGIIFICGNGGSASDSEHIAGELLKSFLVRRKSSGKVRKIAIKTFGAKEGRYETHLCNYYCSVFCGGHFCCAHRLCRGQNI